MSDREARVLGVVDFVDVDGVRYKLSPLTFGVLEQIQRECVRSYKQSYLNTYQQNKDFLAPGVFEEKLEQVARWDIKNLPSRVAYSCASIPINDAIVALLEKEFGAIVKTQSEAGKRSLLTHMLDCEKVTTSAIEELTGSRPASGIIAYDYWWVTATHEGQRVMLEHALSDNHTSIDVSKWPPAKIIEAVRIVEKLSKPDVGNT